MDTEINKHNEGMKDLEVVTLQKRVSELESQLEEAKRLIQKHLLEANEVDVLKTKSADTLTKAKSVIFENTKMMKNQELQIEALNQQVESLRDVVKITKELLEIRNLEVDQLESKIHCMEEKHKAEKERQDLMHKRLEQMIRYNGDLKREYETQLCLFKALRERYDERELAKGVVDSLKSDIKEENNKKDGQISQSTQKKDNEKTGSDPELKNTNNSTEEVKNIEKSAQEEQQQKKDEINEETSNEKTDCKLSNFQENPPKEEGNHNENASEDLKSVDSTKGESNEKTNNLQ